MNADESNVFPVDPSLLVALYSSNLHCGECDNACGANRDCVNSVCECTFGFDECNGSCGLFLLLLAISQSLPSFFFPSFCFDSMCIVIVMQLTCKATTLSVALVKLRAILNKHVLMDRARIPRQSVRHPRRIAAVNVVRSGLSLSTHLSSFSALCHAMMVHSDQCQSLFVRVRRCS